MGINGKGTTLMNGSMETMFTRGKTRTESTGDGQRRRNYYESLPSAHLKYDICHRDVIEPARICDTVLTFLSSPFSLRRLYFSLPTLLYKSVSLYLNARKKHEVHVTLGLRYTSDGGSRRRGI